MPRGDGTGPRGQGPKTGRGMRGSGMGTGRGAGIGSGIGTGRMGRMNGTQAGAGPDGQCICPSCSAAMAHKVGVPCYQSKCPKCGTAMVRK